MRPTNSIELVFLPGHVYRPLVGAVLLFAAYRLLMLSRRGSGPDPIPVTPHCFPAMAWGAVIGLLSGPTGVGGGIVLSPLLLLMGWAETRESAGVAAAFILANSIAGLAGNVAVVHAIPKLICWLIPAAILGGYLGSEFGSKRLQPVALRRLLALALLIAAVKIILPR